MSGYIFAVTLCVLLVLALVQLLRKRRIREKYAGIWILVALGVAVLGAFPTSPSDWPASSVSRFPRISSFRALWSCCSWCASS
ncbi:DUF2304 family protein [Oerskovia sp. M15]